MRIEMLNQTVNVHELPIGTVDNELADSTVLVIDLLRATTTICCALAAGATEVVPFRTIEETISAAERAGRDRVVLGGERGGRRIEGFDLGNSPSEYTPESVGGRPVFITTTNGTQALYHARKARRVLVAAIVNLSAAAASVQDEPRVDILCAGTNGRVTEEDILAAGALVRRMCERASGRGRMNENAAAAANCWLIVEKAASVSGRSLIDELAIMLRNSEGGRNLIDVGLEHDISDCAQIDKFDFVPEFDVHAWRITASQRQYSV